MKFALTAAVALPALAAAMPQVCPGCPGPTPLDARVAALKAEYEAIGPQLSALGIGGLKDIGIDLNSIIDLGATPLTYYRKPDLALLKANGYADLAVRLENAGALSLESGERGLIALKAVVASGLSDGQKLAEANQVAIEASDIGLKALATLPKPETLKPGTLENLRSLGLNNVADSLVSVQRGLAGGDKASKFLAALSLLGDDKAGAQTVATYNGIRTEAAVPYVAAPAAPAAAPVAPAAAPVASGIYSFPAIGYAGYPYYG